MGSLENSINEAAKDSIPVKMRKTQEQWMTKEIHTMMDERRKVKVNEEEYRHLCKIMKSECINSKEKWLEEQCQDIES